MIHSWLFIFTRNSRLGLFNVIYFYHKYFENFNIVVIFKFINTIIL